MGTPMRFYAARMSSHANKCRLKQGIRHRREGVRRGREGDPEAPDPERDPTKVLHMRVQLHTWVLVFD